ncbi:hypothetical protein CWATWH8502_3493 [Crocosphaera watsonii WH 8502]|uniref:Uncharacterized protein n=1 Tax=Crocosphaera watsonii WH 8502 TaxID=423474 RepID=T2IEV0_CROWT|nr:hypothetical protein CWATWH8502_3493 [Crocosphaera watsonii WH 8502]
MAVGKVHPLAFEHIVEGLVYKPFFAPPDQPLSSLAVLTLSVLFHQ